eukprot:TRINITY_DN4270_c0_g1_i2.p1 TRINITY_DN4270_c0_g1~~TRINITY_DN4270_c0_g1_i2.p1  ORF type:complete len:457 (-),score=70.54 TRINITY_DN4270_c0_g1_i2:132-1502(-)
MCSFDAAAVDRRRLNAVMGAASDEVVSIKQGTHQGDPSEISVHCPDKVGLGCDLARIVFEFGLSVVRGDLQTDGRWCYVVFWVVPSSSRPVRWAVLKQRLTAACPSSQRQIFEPATPPEPKPKQMCLLQLCSNDRAGLLNDVAQALWELELTIHRVKVSTSPDGKAIDLFFVTDDKDKLPAKDRATEVCEHLRRSLKDVDTILTAAGFECGNMDCAPASHLPPAVAECLFNDGVSERESSGQQNGQPQGGQQNSSHQSPQKSDKFDSADHVSPQFTNSVDNVTSPSHTVLQISCKDRKGLLYDSMRSLKNVKLQVAYGRITSPVKGTIDLDLFLLQSDGRKILDPHKQKNLLQMMERELQRPLRVVIVTRGPDTELLVATPIEFSGRGRPRVLYDITLALKMLDICIFKADITRHAVGDRFWEVYRFLLIDKPELALTTPRIRSLIADRVRNILMG